MSIFGTFLEESYDEYIDTKLGYVEEYAKNEIYDNIHVLRNSLKELCKEYKYVHVANNDEIMYKTGFANKNAGFVSLLTYERNNHFKKESDADVYKFINIWKKEIPKKVLSIIRSKPEFKMFSNKLDVVGSGKGSKEYLCAIIKVKNIEESYIEESVLSLYGKIALTEEMVKRYKDEYPVLKHIRVNKNTKGYFYFGKRGIAAYINTEKKSDGSIYIQALEVMKGYQNHGLGTALLDVATKELKATKLSVNKKNTVAYNMYKKYGWKVDKEDDTMYYMSYKN